MVFSTFAPIVAVASALTVAAAAPRVDPSVHRALRSQGTVNLMVTMKEGTQTVLNRVQESAFQSRADRITALVEDLQLHAAVSQAPITQMLAQESGSNTVFAAKKEFWITNQVLFEGATFELVEALAKIPTVHEMHEERVMRIPEPVAIDVASNDTAVLAAEWGVTKVRATDVWATGNTGQNVVVASIDTGVRATHAALKGNYRATYGWFDPEAKKAAPYDNNGHGTHTMGTIAGQNGIGVAPGSTWISCKGCRTRDCPESDLLACAEFITCPTDTQGKNKDCSKAPALVSNSWAGGQGDEWFEPAVQTWLAAGILPIFGQGNAGPSCSTANSPGDYASVIGVGATDINDGLANFSSKGPSVDGVLKPDISAPGVNIRSAWSTGDSEFKAISGTSMATPHVSGVVALLVNDFPNLTFAQVKQYITGTTDKSLKAVTQKCGGSIDGVYPNNYYGYGRINALSALNAAKAASA